MLKLTHSVVDIAITCSHFDESLRFYGEKLGFDVILDVMIPADVAIASGLAPTGFRQVRLQAGQTLIKLMDIRPAPARLPSDFRAGVRWLTFFVEDVAETRDDLLSRGVAFLSEPVTAPDAGGVVCALDPDGILIEFVQT